MVDSIFSLMSVAAAALAFAVMVRTAAGVVAGGRGRPRRTRVPRSYARRMRGGRGPLGWGLILVIKTLIVCLRFACGLPLNGVRRTDATLFHAGTAVTNDAGSWLMRGPSWWSFRPYWQRAAVRWAVVVALVAYLLWPIPTMIVGGLAAATAAYLAGRRWLSRFRLRRHHRELLRPLFAALAPYLKLDEQERADDWVDIPPTWQTDRSAVITLHYPEGWDPTDQRQARIEAVMARFLGSGWDTDWSTYSATWRHAPAPPAEVAYTDLRPERFAAHTIPVGLGARDKLITVPMLKDSPHWFVTAPSGHGKTAVLRLAATHTRRYGGWLIDIIDFKQESFARSLEGVPGVRVHTDVISAVYAFCEFYVSMKGAQLLRREGRQDEITPRMLIIDEFGSLMRLAKSWWALEKKRNNKSGELPILNAFLNILEQGRSGEHRIIVGSHDTGAKLFGDTGARDLFVFRLMLGPCTAIKWRKTFGQVPRIEYDADRDGRGVIGLGEYEVEEIQYGFINDKISRQVAMAGPPPPKWFAANALPPWVTPDVITQASREAGIEIVSPAGTDTPPPDQTEGDVPPERPAPSPSPRPADPPPSPQPATLDAPAEKPRETARESVKAHAFGDLLNGDGAPADSPEVEPVAVPHLQVVRRDQEPWIVGYQGAAQYLTSAGWLLNDKSFKRIRNKERAKGNPIHGESRTEDGKPCWKPSELRAWQKRRKIAGRRQFDEAGGAR